VKHSKIFIVVTFFFVISEVFIGCKKTGTIITEPPIPVSQVFSKTFGGDKDDYFSSIAKTTDGGYVMTGAALSGNGSGDIPAAPAVGGNQDIMIVKVGPDGNKQWVTTIGGDQDDYARYAVSCPDGSGYMIAGYTSSNNTGDIPATRGGFDMVIIKLGIDGRKQWVKTYGGNGSDEAHAIVVSSDGNSFVVAGSTTSNNNGDIPRIHEKLFSFFSEIIVMQIQSDGTVQWIKNYGGNMGEDVRDMIVSPDGTGYALAGYTTSNNNGDIPAIHDRIGGIPDMLVLKLGNDGNKQWVKTFGGIDFDFATSIAGSTDGTSYVVTGTALSNNNGDIPATQGDYDIVLVKLDAAGNKQWLKTYGGNQDDEAFSIAPIPGGDYVIAGFTTSDNSGDIPKSHATPPFSSDVLVARFGPDGTIRWMKPYGGNENDQGFGVTYSTDGSFVIAAMTASKNSFDVLSNHGISGSTDGWLMKIKD
jgi:hypothetical protein